MKVYIVKFRGEGSCHSTFQQDATMVFKNKKHATDCYNALLKHVEDIWGIYGDDHVSYEESEVLTGPRFLWFMPKKEGTEQ